MCEVYQAPEAALDALAKATRVTVGIGGSWALFVVRVIFAIMSYRLRHVRLPLLGLLAQRIARG